ncbi:hypothetical protein LOCUS_16790 [Campylobacter jejuni]|nr:hypothetical protein LOCUS_16790 [Campylobacter jejuni]
MSLIKTKDFDELCEIENFKNFLKDCFKAPRKQLLGNLKTYKAKVLEVLSTLGLKENIRPHEICVDSYLKIYDKLKDEYGRKQRDK